MRRVLSPLWLLLVSACASARPSAEPARDAGATAGDAAQAADVPPGGDGAAGEAGATDGGTGGGDAQRELDAAGAPLSGPGERAVTRGGTYFGVPERFNRYYTDPGWTPSTTLWVSPSGGGDGRTPSAPTTPTAALALARPGTRVTFLAGAYAGCFELDETRSGTYDAPIVLYGERGPDGARAVRIDCCATGRQTCFNLEQANHVAVDGFELRGGRYGVRGVGTITGDAATHQQGLAVIDCEGRDQDRDPFFTGQSDWAVLDGVVAHGAGAGDGHGVYLSNGSDFLIVRNAELYGNASSDLQINADPQFGCADTLGIDFTDPRCDGSALEGLGEGVSEYVLLEYNYLHHGDAQGPNFTSVRRSMVRNNVIGFYARHGFSFWQETDHPGLGSADNQVLHNLFVTTNARHALQFVSHSDRNVVRNNLFLGLAVAEGGVSASPSALLMEVDGTVSNNVYAGNAYVGGRLDGRSPTAGERVRADFDAAWFEAFGAAAGTAMRGYRVRASSPFAAQVPRLAELPLDASGAARADPTAIGPFEAR